MKTVLVFLLPILSSITSSWGQGPLDIKPCDVNSKNTGPSLPTLPKQFFSRIELTFVDEKRTVYMEEYFDQIGNRAEIRSLGLSQPSNETRFIASYNTGELFHVEGDRCESSPIHNTDDFIFAFNNTGGRDHVMSAQESLEFGKKFKEVFIGAETVRNIPVNHWQACVMQNGLMTTIDYYFTIPGKWDVPASSVSAVPVKSVYHTGEHTGSTQEYNYIYFQDSLPDSNEPFLTPPMVYCPGRKNTKPLPKIARHFKFRAESVMDTSSLVLSYDMWYDYDNGLTQIAGVPINAPGNKYGIDPFREIRDFKAGIVYTIDMIYGNCSVVPIDADMMDIVNKGVAFLKNQSDFFHLDIANYTYVGQRKTRDIDTDVWIGQTYDYPAGSNLTSTWEWHFSKPGVYFNTGDTNKSHPVRFAVSVSGGAFGYQYNVIDFDDSPLFFSEFDVTPCYEDSEIRRFGFDLVTANQDEVPDFDLFPVRDAIATAVSIQTSISMLRVQNVQVDYKQKGVHTSFDMLGLPTVSGDAAITGQPSTPLDSAAYNLKQIIEQKHFSVLLTTGGQKVTLTGVPGTVKQLVRTKDGRLVPIEDKPTVKPQGPSVASPTVPNIISQCVVSGNASPRRARSADNPPLPSLPSAYFARIEFSMSGENKSVFMEEYFNETANKAEFRIVGLHDAAQEERYISSYGTQEFFTIENNECYSSPIMESDTFIFPYKINNGKDHILSSQEALQFGKNDNEQYIGKTTVRNIPVNHWRSCIRYPKVFNETVTIDYYFADDDLWTLAGGTTATPIKSVFHSQAQTDSGIMDYYNYYEYVYFQDYLPEANEPFLTPPMIFCPDRKNTKPLPALPSQFTYRTEAVMDTLPLIMAYDMWYDSSAKLTRMDGVPLQVAGNQYGTDPFSEIRDFNTGIRYTVDRLLGNCSVTPLDIDLTATQDSDGMVILKSQRQLFDLDGGNFTYVGQRKVRDIVTDVWIGQRNDFPVGSNLTSTWEWHFSKPGLYFNTGDPTKIHPVRFAVSVPSIPLGYQYNIIDFDDSPIDYSAFDISPCFVDGEIQRFQLDLRTVSGDPVPDFDLVPMKDGIRSAAMTQAGVSVLRVQEVEVDYDQKGVHTSFALLGTPTVTGDAPFTGLPDLPLDVVAGNLKSNIDKGQFSVTLNKGKRKIVLKAVSGSLKRLVKTEDGKLVLLSEMSSTSPVPTQTGTAKPLGQNSTSPVPAQTGTAKPLGQSPPGSPGVSGGAVAGVSIATAILGLVFGVCLTYYLYRRKLIGTSIPMERFQ